MPTGDLLQLLMSLSPQPHHMTYSQAPIPVHSLLISSGILQFAKSLTHVCNDSTAFWSASHDSCFDRRLLCGSWYRLVYSCLLISWQFVCLTFLTIAEIFYLFAALDLIKTENLHMHLSVWHFIILGQLKDFSVKVVLPLNFWKIGKNLKTIEGIDLGSICISYKWSYEKNMVTNPFY